MMNKPGKTGIARMIAATDYSWRGLKACWRNEEAFRIEACLMLFFMPLSFVVGSTLIHQLLLFLICSGVILAELINSAIESVVDRIGLEQHELSGQAKDIGSAIVFVSLLTFGVLWLPSLWAFYQLTLSN